MRAVEGAACDDGDPCTRDDVCTDGVCAGTSYQCAPAACQSSASCDGLGGCVPIAALDGTACDDGDACTRSDGCRGGACVGAQPVVCSARDGCHLAGTCDPASGSCSDPHVSDGTACDDGAACTRVDQRRDGACVGGDPVLCPAQDGCHLAGGCDPATGACSQPSASDGTPCDDGDRCTIGDACTSGVCAGAPLICAAQDGCHLAGRCDPADGLCNHPNARDGVACSDGNACTLADHCYAGACVAGHPLRCAAADACHAAGACDPGSGQCEFPQPVAPVGMIAFYRGDDDAIDSAGGLDGALLGGASYRPGHTRAAFFFDGEGGAVRLPRIAALAGADVTLSAWVEVSAYPDQAVWLVGQNQRTSLYLAADGRAGLRYVGSDDELHAVADAEPLALGRWVQVVGVLSANGEGSTGTLYRDGQPVASAQQPGAAPAGDNGCRAWIGGIDDGGDGGGDGDDSDGCAAIGQFFAGGLDEVRVFGRALAPGEIAALHDQEDAAVGALTGPPCDDGDACTQIDQCQSGACVGGAPLECESACEEAPATCDPASGQCSAPDTGCPPKP